jgi:putative spermidine/putrescine transport system substrate-binding protein
MRYAATPEVQAKQALVFGETPVNPRACPVLNRLDSGACAKWHLNTPLPFYKKLFFWKTPVSDCGNGSKSCMDYNAWQRAWTSVRG